MQGDRIASCSPAGLRNPAGLHSPAGRTAAEVAGILAAGSRPGRTHPVEGKGCGLVVDIAAAGRSLGCIDHIQTCY